MVESPVEILLVEDNPHDVELTLHVFERNGIANRMHVVRDGAEALDFIFGTGVYAGRKTENGIKLILLDLKLPKVDGLEVLRRLKGDARTRAIPVVILTCSKDKDDVLNSYAEGANSFFTKPLDYKDLVGLMGLLKAYWFQQAQLPV